MTTAPLAEGERGVYLVTLAVWLTGLLVVVAFVIDAASLYRHRLLVQRAADLGCLAGLGYRATKGWGYLHEGRLTEVGVNGSRDAEVEDAARETIRTNLALHDVVPEESGVTVRYSSLDDRISVSLRYEVPLLLVGHIPGINGCTSSNTCRVSASATAELRPANIALVLDTSGSMNCPADEAGASTACACLEAGGCSGIPEGQRKLSYLKDAVRAYIEFFNPNRDRVTVVPFNAVSTVAFSVLGSDGAALPFGSTGPAGTPEDRTRVEQFYQVIEGLEASGNTNVCDGLWRAYEDLASASPPILRRSPTFFVLFSDGAPSAGRFRFTALTDNLRTRLSAVPAAGSDWWMGTTEWRDQGPVGPVRRYDGPSQLVRVEDIPYGYAEGVPPAGAYTCGDLTPYHDEFPASVSPCLRSYRFDAWAPSGHRREVSGDGRELDFDDPLDFIRHLFYAQQSYICAVELSDMVREVARGTVYTVGLGPLAFAGSSDPFQNLSDELSRKEFFLRRLALDRFHGSRDPAFGPRREIVLNDPRDAGFGSSVVVGYGEYRGYAAFAEDPAYREREGTYEGTQDARALRQTFVRVAKDILIRLIE